MRNATAVLAIGAMYMLALTNANAAPMLSDPDVEVPIASRGNVFAGAPFNDSPGSSDLSFNPQLTIGGKILVEVGTACKAIVPEENIPDDDDPIGWTLPGFDDSDWEDAEYGVGYADNDDATVMGDGQHAAIYTRTSFDVGGTGGITELEIGMDWDDGFVVWINGVEAVRESGTDIFSPATWDSWTDAGNGHSHEATGTLTIDDLAPTRNKRGNVHQG